MSGLRRRSTRPTRRIPQARNVTLARLIASAPELLRACRVLVEVAIPDQDPTIMLAATEQAKAAIAKATGETEDAKRD